jgi:hypothetical protein
MSTSQTNAVLGSASDEEIVIISILVIRLLRARANPGVPRFISAGRDRYIEILRAPRQCWETLGCSVSTFLALTRWIAPRINRRLERKVSVEEKVALFLYICRHASGHRNCENYFARSADTVSHAFNEILSALVSLHPDVVQQPKMETPIPCKIASNPKFAAFRDCVGAIDGTHFHARVPAKSHGTIVNQKPWLNRKGYLSQNVAAACDFDLKFSFVHAGFEGSAHDALVLKDALMKQRFRPVPGRYYLADAGYYHCDFLMKPYNATRYHLREWNEPGAAKPETKEELFNLRHSQLRSHIERIFGILKRKFKILTVAPQYSLPQQRDLVIALTAVFNFVAERDRQNDIEIYTPITLSQNDTPSIPLPIIESNEAARKRMDQKRDQIAEEMFIEYKRIRTLREIAVYLTDNDV